MANIRHCWTVLSALHQTWSHTHRPTNTHTGKSSITLLAQVISTSLHAPVRQLASVLLRVKVQLHWNKLSLADKQACKHALLQTLINERVRIVRLNVSYAVAATARHALAGGPNGWTELLQFIRLCMNDYNNWENRELAYSLLAAMTGIVGTALSSMWNELMTQYAKGLETETDPRVFGAILRATSSLIEFLSDDDEVMKFQSVVGLLLNALSRGDFIHDEAAASSAIQVIELLSELAESSVNVLDPYVDQSCALLCALTTSNRVSADDRFVPSAVRSAAATALADMLEFKPRLISKSKSCLATITPCILSLARESTARRLGKRDEEEDDDDEENDDQGAAALPGNESMSTLHMSEMLVSAFAGHLPTKVVVETLLNSSASMISAKGNALEQASGLLVLAVLTEGIQAELIDKYSKEFEGLLGKVMDAVETPNQSLRVTRYGFLVLGQWADYLWPLMQPHTKRVLSASIHWLNCDRDAVVEAASNVVRTFCDGMDDDEIAPYVNDIAIHALDLFSRGSRLTPRVAITAIQMCSALSLSAKQAFAPHFDRCLIAVSPMLNLQGEEYGDLRAHATALLGHLAIVSVDCTPQGAGNPFFAHVPEILSKSFAALTVDDINYRESVHSLCGNVALAMGVHIEPFLKEVLQVLLSGCLSDDGDVRETFVDRGGAQHISELIMRVAGEARNDDDDEEDEDEVDRGKVVVSVREAAADSKAAALSSLESICSVYWKAYPARSLRGTQLASSLVVISNTALEASEHLHPSVRANALELLGKTVALGFAIECDLPPIRPTREQLEEYASRTFLDADLERVWLPDLSWGNAARARVPEMSDNAEETVIPLLLESMTCDTQKSVAAKVCETLQLLAQETGPTFLGNPEHSTDVLLAFCTLLRGEGVCQRHDERLNDDDDQAGHENDDDDEFRRHDEQLLDNVVEGLAAVTKALGPDAIRPMLGEVLPALMRRSKPKMPLRDRICAVGALSQLITNARGGYDPSSGNKLVNVAMDAMRQSDDACLRRNGLVLLGALVDSGERRLDLLTCLTHLRPLFAHHVASAKEKERVGTTTSWELEDDLAVVDNASALVARCLLREDFPAEAVEGVTNELLEYLPLKFDHDEDWIVYTSLSKVARGCSVAMALALFRVCARGIFDVRGQGSRRCLKELITYLSTRLTISIAVALGGIAMEDVLKQEMTQ